MCSSFTILVPHLQSTNYPFCMPRNVPERMIRNVAVKRLANPNRVNCLSDVIGQSGILLLQLFSTEHGTLRGLSKERRRQNV